MKEGGKIQGCILSVIILLMCGGLVAETKPPENLDALQEVYSLNEGALAKLYQNGFIVLKDIENPYLSEVYMNLFFKEDVSVFITSDVMLQIFHNIHDEMLKNIEKEYLHEYILNMVEGLQERSEDDYTSASADLIHVKEAARRNVLFFSVARKLLDESAPVPEYVEKEVNDYVKKIMEHAVTEFYPGDD
jgi:hypothetical protein